MILSKNITSPLNSLLLIALIMPQLSFGNYADMGKKVGKGVWHTAQMGAGVLAAFATCLEYSDDALYVVTSGALIASSVGGFKKLLGKTSSAQGREHLSKKQKIAKGLWAAAQLGLCGCHVYRVRKNNIDTTGWGTRFFLGTVGATLIGDGVSSLKDLWAGADEVEDGDVQVDGTAQELNS